MLDLTLLTHFLVPLIIKYLLLLLNKIPRSILRATNRDPLKSILSGNDQQILTLHLSQYNIIKVNVSISALPIPCRSSGHLEQYRTSYR